MSKPLKTFEETLADEMKDPEFREGYLRCRAELDDFARIRDMPRASGLSQETAGERMETSQSAARPGQGKTAFDEPASAV